ncbi:MAG: mitochondrial fission ELM1 family protein [Rhodospirillales bacterium]|nr:mitochondrial fission ELM1 family protein [Rhodospirillales bacterium]
MTVPGDTPLACPLPGPAAGGGEQQTGGPSTWLVLGDKLGDNAQAEIIAASLGWPCERRSLRFRPEFVLGKPPFKPSLYHLDLARSDPLEPPWPELILTIGRRPSMAALWVREQSGGRTKVVLIGRPKRNIDDFALIIATPQYRLPARGNVVHLDLPLMRADPERIGKEVEAWRDRLAGLPRPLTAVLVGGPTKPFIFDAAVTRSLIELTLRSTEGHGTLYATTSRRTPDAVVGALKVHLPASAGLFAWAPEAGDNPYLALLGFADRFVVTGDSISMMVEVARLGRPLAVFPLPVGIPATWAPCTRGSTPWASPFRWASRFRTSRAGRPTTCRGWWRGSGRWCSSRCIAGAGRSWPGRPPAGRCHDEVLSSTSSWAAV